MNSWGIALKNKSVSLCSERIRFPMSVRVFAAFYYTRSLTPEMGNKGTYAKPERTQKPNGKPNCRTDSQRKANAESSKNSDVKFMMAPVRQLNGNNVSRREHPVPRKEYVVPSQRESKVSAELRKLSFEDVEHREIALKATKDSKVENNYEIVFGVSPCLLALTQGWRMIWKLFVKEGEKVQRAAVRQVCKEAERLGVQVQRVPKKELDKMAPGQVHQGLCLQASPLSYLNNDRSLKTIHENGNKKPIWLVLDGVQDPMNLGAVLRSAYFLGVDRVASSIRNSCPLTPVVSKASSGVMEIMGVYGYENLADLLKVKKIDGWEVVGTVGAGSVSFPVPVIQCSDFKMTKPTLLLMGGEGKGLSLELLQQCNFLLTIPARRNLHPGVESLNISVATGILLYTLLSSRGDSHQ